MSVSVFVCMFVPLPEFLWGCQGHPIFFLWKGKKKKVKLVGGKVVSGCVQDHFITITYSLLVSDITGPSSVLPLCVVLYPTVVGCMSVYSNALPYCKVLFGGVQ